MSWSVLTPCALCWTALTDQGNNDNCSARQLGYNVSAIAAEATPNTYYGGGLGNLTHAFVLHPVAAGQPSHIISV